MVFYGVVHTPYDWKGLIQKRVSRNRSCKSWFLNFSSELDHFNGFIICIYYIFQISQIIFFSFKCTTHNNKVVLEPRVSPAFAITYFCNHCNVRFENLNQRSLPPRWPLTPCLLRSHVWLYPRIIVSKSHDNTSMYVDTVINFAKYHIHTHTTYILHTHTTYRTSDHIVSYWTQFRRDKN